MAETSIQWCDYTFTEREKLNARALVNARVKAGKLPHPNERHCVDCGHISRFVGDRRHEYDHPRGYTGKGKTDVEVVCTRCHAKRDSTKAKQTHCLRGHAFTAENTYRAKNGTRHCRTCRRAYDRRRVRPPGYWKRINAKRRAI